MNEPYPDNTAANRWKRIEQLAPERRMLLARMISTEINTTGLTPTSQHNTTVPTTLIAWVVLDPNQDEDLNEIKEFVRKRLPDYMTPSRFMHLDALPRLANGKVDRNALHIDGHDDVLHEEVVCEPRDRVELTLCEIWKTLLGLPYVGIDDDFFELGGHSLLTTQLVTQIEQRLGQTLSVADVYERPTVKELSEKIRAGDETKQWCSIVPINSRGNRPPFFCVLGNPRALGPHLDPERPFYWLHHGQEGVFMPYAAIDQIAADHLEQILAIQDQGPYFIGGFSVGGLIALEMARLLRKQRKEVAMLALFDPTNPAHDQILGWRARFNKTLTSDASPWHKGRYVLVRLAKLPSIAIKMLARWGRRLKLRTMRYYYFATNTPMPKKIRAAHRWNVLLRAARQYRYAPYDSAITLFLPEGNPADLEQFEALQHAWRSVAGERLETQRIQGAREHLDLVREPFVRDLAVKLNDCLARTAHR